jgi:hypothetical protein
LPSGKTSASTASMRKIGVGEIMLGQLMWAEVRA